MSGRHRAADLPAPPWPLVQRTAPLRPVTHGRHVARFATPAEATARALQALIPQQRKGREQ